MPLFTFQIHGPCGKENPTCPCMQVKGTELICSKDFPKDFHEKTRQDGESYPVYRRRSPEDGGQEYVKVLSNNTRWVITNKDVSSPVLLDHLIISLKLI